MNALDEAGAVQGELDAIDTQLSIALNAIEDALRARLHMRIQIVAEGASFIGLAFGKNKAEWRLLIKYENGDWTPLNSATRAVRTEVLAGGHLRRLIDESCALLRAELAKRADATQEANALLTQLGAQTTHQEH